MENNTNNVNNNLIKCYGIDLGTTLSVCGIWDNNSKTVKIIEDNNGNKLIPSVLFFTDENERLVGATAKQYGLKNINNCIYESKRLMGKKMFEINPNDFNYKLEGDMYDKVQIVIGSMKMYPEQVAGAILQYIKLMVESKTGEEVNNVVITVPAYFNDSQRTATKLAAKIAGLNVLQLINEPTAACLCYGLNKGDGGKFILVYDLGGGTLDVSLVEINNGLIEVIGVGGDSELGGKDFDQVISNYIIKKFHERTGLTIKNEDYNKIKSLAETIKKDLSNRLSIMVDMEFNGTTCSFKFTRKEFEELSSDLFVKCITPVKDVISDADLSIEDINEIVLVGGSSRIPKIQSQLSALFKGKKLNNTVNPDEAVAFGAAIQGAILSQTDNTGSTSNLTLLDVIPLSLGVKLYNGTIDIIIPKNTNIPCDKTKTYTTNGNINEKSINIELYEGLRPLAKDNHKLGQFELQLPLIDRRKNKLKIDVKFSIDINGILSVTAKSDDLSSSMIVNTAEQLNESEIAQMISSADEYKFKDMIALERIKLTKDLEDYIESQQYLINSPEAELSEDTISDANILMLQTLEWLYSPDVLSGELPTPDAIRECKEAVVYRLNLIPWGQSRYEKANKIVNGDDETNANMNMNMNRNYTDNDINEILKNLKTY